MHKLISSILNQIIKFSSLCYKQCLTIEVSYLRPYSVLLESVFRLLSVTYLHLFIACWCCRTVAFVAALAGTANTGRYFVFPKTTMLPVIAQTELLMLGTYRGDTCADSKLTLSTRVTWRPPVNALHLMRWFRYLSAGIWQRHTRSTAECYTAKPLVIIVAPCH